MNILFLIVARSGSKRLKNKNVLNLGHKPLIQWTIDHAKQLTKSESIMVSTDDEEVQKISLKSNITCPWIRPKELSSDDAETIDVVFHALDWFEEQNRKVDGIFLMQPTSPFRSIENSEIAIKNFLEKKQSVIAVTDANNVSKNTFYIENNYLKKFNSLQNNNMLTKIKLYNITGSIYISTIDNLRKRRSFFSENTIPLLIDNPKECIDIDYIEDFNHAKKYI